MALIADPGKMMHADDKQYIETGQAQGAATAATPTERKRAHPSGDRHSAALVVLFQDLTKKIGRD